MTAPRPTTVVDIVADPVCPWCYIGLRAFAIAARDLLADMTVLPRLRAYQLNPGTPRDGLDRQKYYEQKFPDPAVRHAQRQALIDAAHALGSEFDPGVPTLVPNTLGAHALIRQAHLHGLQEPVAKAIYEHFWHLDEDIGSDDVLRRIGNETGMEPAWVDAALTEAPAGMREQACAEAEAMRSAGVTGIPTFIVNERTGFSGALPPPELARAIRQASVASPSIISGTGAVPQPEEKEL